MIAEGPNGCARHAAAHQDRPGSTSVGRTGRALHARGAEAPAQTGVERTSDRVDLSTRSPVREEKIAQARDRIAQGYYQRPDVREALGRILLDQLGAGR